MTRSRNLWLLAIVVLCGFSLWWGWRGGDMASEQGAPAGDDGRRPPAVDLEAVVAPIHLEVLNGTATKGLARDFSLSLTVLGCVIERIDNGPHDRFQNSLLINRRLDDRRAESLAAQLGGIPVLLEWDGRTSADAVLVLGADHAEVRENLNRSIDEAARAAAGP